MQYGRIIIFFAAVSGCLANISLPPDLNLDSETQGKIVKVVALAIIRGYEQELINLMREYNQIEDAEAETQATLFPPFPDEDIPLDPLSGTLPQELGGIVAGSYDFQDVIVKGAAGIHHDYQLKLLPFPYVTFIFNLTTGTSPLSLGGAHDTQLIVFEENNITGNGSFDLKVVDAVIGLEVRIFPNFVTDRVSITRFVLDLSYEDFAVSFDGTELNGMPINWAQFNAVLNNYIKKNWPEIKASLTNLVLEQGNGLLQRCKLSEIIAGNLGCLFEEVVPTTEASTETDTSETPTETVDAGESTTPETSTAGSRRIEQASTLMFVFFCVWLFS